MRGPAAPRAFYVQVTGALFPDISAALGSIGRVAKTGTAPVSDPSGAWAEVRMDRAVPSVSVVYAAFQERGIDPKAIVRVVPIREGDGPTLAKQITLVEPGEAVIASQPAPQVAARPQVSGGEQMDLFGSRK